MHMPVLSEADKRFDHEVEIMKNRNPEEYFAFRRRMDVWYRQNRKILISMLQLLDIDKNQKKVSYETMKRALLDLDIPCTRVEMHAICLLLDRRNRRMIKIDLPKRLCRQIKPTIYSLQTDNLDAPDSFICIHFKFIPLLSEVYLPCHFQATVPSDMYVSRLSDVITEETNLRAKAWYIFCSRDTCRNPPLPANFVINKLRVNAGSEDNPGVVELFYIGEMDFLTCPVILSDYYCFMTTRRNQRRIQNEKAEMEKIKAEIVFDRLEYLRTRKELEDIQRKKSDYF